MTILLVEDDVTLNRNIKEYFQNEKYIVETAFDGQVAERLLKKSKYDCIIMDINIPIINGYELVKNFRNHNQSTPVLFLTAFEELEDKVKGFEYGADDYLTKPFYLKELEIRVKSLINRKLNISGNNSKIIMIDDLIIDETNKSVKRANQIISLTPKEYDILHLLAKSKGQLVSKSDLVKNIWGNNLLTNNNTIEVYINFLRKKIDKPYEKQLIKTKVGYGYILEE